MLLDKTYRSAAPVRLGLLALLGLLAFSWYFYRERVAYQDLAFHLFVYLRENQFFIQNRRFVAGITQAVPLLGSRAGWPIDALMRAYSVTFMVYYGAVFALCAWWLRNARVALVVALLFTLLVARTFYWAQSELPQALAVLLFCYAGVGRQAPLRRRWSTLALALLLPVVIFGHPLALLPFLFLWGYDWLLHRRFTDPLYYGLLALALATYWWRTATIPPGSYEATRLGTGQLVELPHLLGLASFRDFLLLCRGNFLALPLALGALTWFYGTIRPAWGAWRLAWVWAWVAGYVALVCTSYPNGAEAGYFENLLLPLGIFVATPLALEVLPALETRGGGRWAAGALTVLLAARLGVIYYAHRDYTAYQQWLDRVLTYTRQFPERKFFIDEQNANAHHQRAPSWAAAYETMLLSARPGPDSARTVAVLDAGQIVAALPAGQRPDAFVTPFQLLRRADLPARYLRLPNTPYRNLNTSPPAEPRALDAYLTALAGGRIELVAVPRALRAGRPRAVVVRLVPPASQVLRSGLAGPHPLLLIATFYSGPDWALDLPEPTTPLELDVYGAWEQPMQLECPPRPGHYTLEIKLISRGYRDASLRLRLPVTVQ